MSEIVGRIGYHVTVDEFIGLWKKTDTGAVEDTNVEDTDTGENTDTEEQLTEDTTDTQDTDTEDTNVEKWWNNEPDGPLVAYLNGGIFTCMLFPKRLVGRKKFSAESLEYTEAYIGSNNIYNTDVCFSDVTAYGRCMVDDLGGFDFTHTVYVYIDFMTQELCENSETVKWIRLNSSR